MQSFGVSQATQYGRLPCVVALPAFQPGKGPGGHYEPVIWGTYAFVRHHRLDSPHHLSAHVGSPGL